MDQLFSVKQAAFILKVHPLTIRRYIKKGTLKAIKFEGNVRIKEKDLNDFHKDIIASEIKQPIIKLQKFSLDKPFSLKDPIFRLLGKGASINS